MKKIVLTLGILSLFPMVSIAGGTRGNHQHSADAHDGHLQGNQMQSKHASAVGRAGQQSEVSKTVTVALLDTMRFEFDPPLNLAQGDVVLFKVSNQGKIRHEFSIGSENEQSGHRQMMQQMPNMVHEDPNTVTVEPGQTKELVWKFEGNVPVVFACNIPGHAEAGMVAQIHLQ